MRELSVNEIEIVGGANRWSVNGMGASNPGQYSYGRFNIGYNIGKPGVNVSADVNVAHFGGKTHWGDRGIMVGFTKKW